MSWKRKLMLVPFEANCTTVQFLPPKFTTIILLLFLQKTTIIAIFLDKPVFFGKAQDLCTVAVRGIIICRREQPLVIHSSSQCLFSLGQYFRWKSISAFFYSASIVWKQFQLIFTWPVLLLEQYFSSNCSTHSVPSMFSKNISKLWRNVVWAYLLIEDAQIWKIMSLLFCNMFQYCRHCTACVKVF